MTDVEKTTVLRAKETHLQELFQDFVARYPEVQQMIEDTYNMLYNRTVSKSYDGSHLTIDGLAQNISLRPHQKNALQRIVKVSGALFLIGLISGLIFIEIYGIYLSFTERHLYIEDLSTNGIWSFTGFFIIFNILLMLGLMTNIVKRRITEYK